MGPSEAEMCYAIHRGTMSDPSVIPHWDELHLRQQEAIAQCIEIAVQRAQSLLSNP